MNVTLNFTEEEENFINSYLEKSSVSFEEMLKQALLEKIEDENDARIADERLAEYEEYLANGGKEKIFLELVEELGL